MKDKKFEIAKEMIVKENPELESKKFVFVDDEPEFGVIVIDDDEDVVRVFNIDISENDDVEVNEFDLDYEDMLHFAIVAIKEMK